MWKAMVDDFSQRKESESASPGSAGSANRRKNGRIPRVASGDLRNAILDAAVRLFHRESGESLNLERIANRTGFDTRRIYRIFGSRKAFLQACTDSLCDRERARWRDAERRSGGEPVQHLLELFIDVAVELASKGDPRGQPQMPGVRFSGEEHPVRRSRATLDGEFRALLMRLAVAAKAVDAEALADTLMMLWEGATCYARSGSDAQRHAERLPALVHHVIGSYMPGRGRA
jgi:AcrR family transcriptional regulator